MQASQPAGRVVTFYSYKGGTGRSMALSNIAWVLAAAGKRVLLIDWDLEAPGLHRYFKPFLIDQELSASEGLMDLIDRYACEAIKPLEDGDAPDADWWLPLADLSDYTLAVDFPHFPVGGGIDLLSAGRQTANYAVKVNAFNWQNFYDRLGGGGFLDTVKKRAQLEYDYILVDSRTGVSDTAGICTVQMPETLVVCFTYNNQSIKGAAAVAASARAKHKDLAVLRRQQRAAGGASAPAVLEDTPRPFRVLPVPMRVDPAESDRLELRQAFAREVFADLLDPDSGVDAGRYWSEVEVPHQPFYSYEEVLAGFKDDPHDPKKVLSAFVRITGYITEGEVSDYRLALAPEVVQRYLGAFAETPLTELQRRATAAATHETADQLLQRQADAALAAMDEPGRALALSVLARLVRIEGDRYYPIRALQQEFPPGQHPTVRLLADADVLKITSNRRTMSQAAPTTEPLVSFADDRLVDRWPPLRQWLAQDAAFLMWRQQLREFRAGWERAQDRAAFLGGSLLAEARKWAGARPEDLNEAELDFIAASDAAAAAAERPASVPLPPQSSQPAARPVHAEAPRAGRRVLLGGVALLLAAPGIYTAWKATLPAPAPVPLPDLSGKEVGEARQVLQALKLQAITVDPVTNEEQTGPTGYVVGQQPTAYANVATGSTVRLQVTREAVKVPAVVGLTVEEAARRLQDRGLVLVVGEPRISVDPGAKEGIIQEQSPELGAVVGPRTNVTVRQVRRPRRVDVVGAYVPQERLDRWRASFRDAGFVLESRTGPQPIPVSGPPEVVYFDAAGAEDASRIVALLRTSGINARPVAAQQRPAGDGASYEIRLAAPLEGYRIDIFFYERDKLGGMMAQAITRQLRSSGFTGTVTPRPSSAEYLGGLYPPQRFEVRYEKGAEDEPAAYLLSLVQRVDGIKDAALFPVRMEKPTVNYLSVFIPRLSS